MGLLQGGCTSSRVGCGVERPPAMRQGCCASRFFLWPTFVPPAIIAYTRPPSARPREYASMRIGSSLLVLLLLSPLHAGPHNSLLDVSADGSRLVSANADHGTATVVDLKARKALHELEVGDKPEGVTFLGDSMIAAVTVYRSNRVVLGDTTTGKAV